MLTYRCTHRIAAILHAALLNRTAEGIFLLVDVDLPLSSSLGLDLRHRVEVVSSSLD